MTKPIESLKCAGYKKFNFKPFGKFRIDTTGKCFQSLNVLEFKTLRFDASTSLKVLPTTDKKIVKMMIQNKTDILIDGTEFYTRMGDGIVKVNHQKIDMVLAGNYVMDNFEGTYVLKDTLKLTEKTFTDESNADFHN